VSAVFSATRVSSVSILVDIASRNSFSFGMVIGILEA
jgi:hypothetical protein